jgi:hypothetical protein
MKRLIIIAFISLVVIGGLVVLANKEGETKKLAFKALKEPSKVEIPFEVKEKANVLQALIETSTVPSVEELEKNLTDKSDEELTRAIELNNSWAMKKQFIAKANANTLDAKGSVEFLKYIRVNSALHKILLERQIESLEQEML